MRRWRSCRGKRALKILGQRKRKKAHADGGDAPGTVELKVEIQLDGVQVSAAPAVKKEGKEEKPVEAQVLLNISEERMNKHQLIVLHGLKPEKRDLSFTLKEKDKSYNPRSCSHLIAQIVSVSGMCFPTQRNLTRWSQGLNWVVSCHVKKSASRCFIGIETTSNSPTVNKSSHIIAIYRLRITYQYINVLMYDGCMMWFHMHIQNTPLTHTVYSSTSTSAMWWPVASPNGSQVIQQISQVFVRSIAAIFRPILKDEKSATGDGWGVFWNILNMKNESFLRTHANVAWPD